MSLDPDTDFAAEDTLAELRAQVEGLVDIVRRMEEEQKEARKDTKRWRWLRYQMRGEKWSDLPCFLSDMRDWDDPTMKYVEPDRLDAEVDAAIAKERAP